MVDIQYVTTENRRGRKTIKSGNARDTQNNIGSSYVLQNNF